MQYMLKVIKRNMIFFFIGAKIGASFRLMFIEILKDLFIECFCDKTDDIRMRWKSDLRYWLKLNLLYFPAKLFPPEPIEIPEKYVYIILAHIITKVKTQAGNLYDFRYWFNRLEERFPLHKSTSKLMNTIIEYNFI